MNRGYRSIRVLVYTAALLFSIQSPLLSQSNTQTESRGVGVHDETQPVNPGRYIVSVIGIDNYKNWPKLHNAVSDAVGFQETLTKQAGFIAPIPPLTNENATRDAILSLIQDRLRTELQPDDNLVLFFAGHGHTRVDQVGTKKLETGFIVPVNSDFGKNEQWSEYIEMEELLKNIGKLPARHILVVLDSCFSGFALGGSVESFRSAPRYQQDLAARVSRKVITSAHLDQLAQDSGSLPGHSLFTGMFIDGMTKGELDLDQDGFVTSSEIGLGLQQMVGQFSQSKQTPDFGSFYLDDRGEMILPVKSSATASRASSGPAPPCYTIQTRYPKVMPFSLKNSLEAQSFLYWFYIEVANNCATPLHLRIDFKVRRGPAVTPKDDVPAQYTVFPGKVLSQKVDPLLEFISADVEGTLEVIWGIRNEMDTLLETGTASIELLPKNTLDWDLATPEGKPVSREFLLASLSAWTTSPDSKLKSLATQLLKNVPTSDNASTYASDWFLHCFTELVQSRKIKIGSLNSFPPAKQEAIQTPAQILDAGFADPIEATLLFAALTNTVARQLDTRTGMIVLEGGTQPPEVLLAWTSGDNTWRAVDLQHAVASGFEQNRQQSTDRLSALIQAEPRLLESLAQTGVYFAENGTTTALNFDAAKRNFHIQGLP